MKTCLQVTLLMLLSAAGTAGEPDPRDPVANGVAQGDSAADYEAGVRAQPKLLRVSGWVDGSGRIVFTRDQVRYEHRHWGWPSRLLFDGEPWTQLDRTPATWSDLRDKLDLTRAWVVERHGRDVVALEGTPDGFDLYLSDSPNGASAYSVTIAIPRRG